MPDKDTQTVLEWATSHWKLLVWVVGIIYGTGVAIDTVATLKKNQDEFLKKTEAVIYRERLIHRLDLMEQNIQFHHPDYYPGPVAPPEEAP